ncbi:MAG: carboxylate-amine ligase [Caldilineales bacterium]
MSTPPSLRLGIEEEYQIVDPETRTLRYIITRTPRDERPVLRGTEGDTPLEPPLAKLMADLAKPVFNSAAELGEALIEQRRAVCQMASDRGLWVAAAGTHPFAAWSQTSTPLHGRYEGLTEEMRAVAKRLLIFGAHIHVAIEDPGMAIDCMNTVRYMLPHLLCLSTSSPFFAGHDTGLKSYRAILHENLPRSGVPHEFASPDEYKHYVELLIKTHCIRGENDIWWDVRPHRQPSSLEFRLFDMMPAVEDTIGLVAAVQAVVAWLTDLRGHNISFRLYPRSLIEENKWRAERYGLDGKLIDFGKEQQLPARTLVRELLRLADPYVERLGSRRQIDHLYQVIERGTSADRQRRVYQQNGGKKNHNAALIAVVDALVAETMICR